MNRFDIQETSFCFHITLRWTLELENPCCHQKRRQKTLHISKQCYFKRAKNLNLHLILFPMITMSGFFVEYFFISIDFQLPANETSILCQFLDSGRSLNGSLESSQSSVSVAVGKLFVFFEEANILCVSIKHWFLAVVQKIQTINFSKSQQIGLL